MWKMDCVQIKENNASVKVFIPDSIVERVKEDSEFREEFMFDLAEIGMKLYEQWVTKSFVKALSESFELKSPKEIKNS